jgi:hypothetical protein
MFFFQFLFPKISKKNIKNVPNNNRRSKFHAMGQLGRQVGQAYNEWQLDYCTCEKCRKIAINSIKYSDQFQGVKRMEQIAVIIPPALQDMF